MGPFHKAELRSTAQGEEQNNHQRLKAKQNTGDSQPRKRNHLVPNKDDSYVSFSWETLNVSDTFHDIQGQRDNISGCQDKPLTILKGSSKKTATKRKEDDVPGPVTPNTENPRSRILPTTRLCKSGLRRTQGARLWTTTGQCQELAMALADAVWSVQCNGPWLEG